jgi:prolyl-tRNA editing enzyme YbaK/EbsC (Cys-tRNA(Pro) deacylase)
MLYYTTNPYQELYMPSELPKSALRVQQALDAFGLSLSVAEFPESTRTAKEAAEAIGCSLGQIVKSLLFMGGNTRKPVMALASGANRVDENALADAVGEKIERANPDFVLEHTGYAIGGVPPVGLSEPVETFVDEDLMGYELVWAAAGTPHAVFGLKPADLVRITGGKIMRLRR